MPRRRRNCPDIEFFAPGRKRRIAGSTKATNDFLVLVHKQNSNATIAELRAILTNRNIWLLNPGAVAVLDAYIRAGFGNYVPDWR